MTIQYSYLRRLPEFEYVAPQTLDEALLFLSQHNGEVSVMAGGTDLLLKMKMRERSPRYLLGLKNIAGLDYIEYKKGQGLKFGPLVTIHAIEVAPVIRDKFPILSQAAATMASAQIRNLGTVAGNLCSALPSADMAPGLMVLQAKLLVSSRQGQRTVPVESFFTGVAQSVLAHQELVVEVQVPEPPANSGMVYIKHGLRGAMDLSIISVAVLLTLGKGNCREARICLGTVAETPMRAVKAEAVLRGKPFQASLVAEAGETAAQECHPRSSNRASAEYRIEMVKVLVQRALNQAREQVR